MGTFLRLPSKPLTAHGGKAVLGEVRESEAEESSARLICQAPGSSPGSETTETLRYIVPIGGSAINILGRAARTMAEPRGK